MRFLLLIPLLALTARAEDESLMTIHRIETETADRIQARVLDPILGPGQSSVFVKVKLEVKRDYEHADREGEGNSRKIKSKAEIRVTTTTAGYLADEGLFDGFGFRSGTKQTVTGDLPWQVTSADKQMQESRQIKGVKEERVTIRNHYLEFRLVVLHDARLPASKLAAARAALLAIYRSENADIKFHPVEFSALK